MSDILAQKIFDGFTSQSANVFALQAENETLKKQIAELEKEIQQKDEVIAKLTQTSLESS